MAVDDRFVRMPFEEAIAFLRQKVDVPTDSSSDVTNAQHDAAFVVAGAKGMVLSELRKAVERAIVDGTRLEDFRQEFDRIAESWEHRGEKAWRARVIYETNVRMAHAAGRYERQLDPEVMRVRPYLQYIHGGSRDPRPHHIALDGQVFPAGQLPFYPPNGYLCSCRTISLSNRDLSRLGLEVSQVKRGDRIPTKVNGKEVEAIIEPDRGFDFIPGRSPQEWRDQYRQQVLTKLQTPIREQVRASMDEADRQAAPKPVPQPTAPAVPSTTLPPEVVAPPSEIPAARGDELGTGKIYSRYQKAGRDRFGGYLARVDTTYKTAEELKRSREMIAGPARAAFVKAMNEGRVDDANKIKAQVQKTIASNNQRQAGQEDPIKVMAELRQALIRSARITSPQVADNIASKFAITPAIAKQYGGEANFRALLAETIQISDGLGLATLRKITLDDSRANAQPTLGTINVGITPKGEQRSTFFHEFAHHWEYGSHAGMNYDLMAAGRDFIFARANSKTPQQLARLSPERGYGADELAMPGVSRLDPYVGRDYGNPPGSKGVLVGTEVFSMGFEYFHSPESMLELYRKDRALFELVLGALRK